MAFPSNFWNSLAEERGGVKASSVFVWCQAQFEERAEAAGWGAELGDQCSQHWHTGLCLLIQLHDPQRGMKGRLLGVLLHPEDIMGKQVSSWVIYEKFKENSWLIVIVILLLSYFVAVQKSLPHLHALFPVCAVGI